MKRVFIVRPFGTKEGRDFDDVEHRLIAPAIEGAGLEGGTTAEILEAGNIRTDMFRELLIADIVIADVSIDNANVYYELGIRHALRAKDTVLIRSPTSEGGRVPFDLLTDRYLRYDGDDPGTSLDDLVKVLVATAESDSVNSPVFNLLPELEENELTSFLPVPVDFSEHVRRAKDNRRTGDLDLLAEEIRGLPWERTGLGVVGHAQFDVKHYRGAQVTWERVRDFDSFDVEANTILGTVYQKLDDLTESDIALDRAAGTDNLSQAARAEVFALQGRNSKGQWREEWAGSPDEESRQEAALTSGHLDAAATRYLNAFEHDLNAYYPGVNALSLHSIRLRLADAHPDVWLDQFDDDEAEPALKQLRKLTEDLQILVRHAVSSAPDEDARWTLPTTADLTCLTSDRPSRVASAYKKAASEVDPFDIESMRDQLQMYVDLGVFVENAEAGLAVLGAAVKTETKRHVVIFAGHRIDAPGRETPRFPPSQEEDARTAIKEALEAEVATSGPIYVGISGAASGGDILFHEVCEELEISTEVYLAMPEADYVRESVADSGPGWVDRFHAICDRGTPLVLTDDGEVPKWVGRDDYSIWQRNNLWVLHNALAIGGDRSMLLALWNGEPGDNVGGTEDLVARTRAIGAKVVHLDTNEIFAS